MLKLKKKKKFVIQIEIHFEYVVNGLIFKKYNKHTLVNKNWSKYEFFIIVIFFTTLEAA